MKIDIEKKAAQILGRNRSGSAAAERSSEGELPGFLAAAEAEARRAGSTAEDVLREDMRRVLTSTYPEEDCLTPDEVEMYVEGETLLPPDRVQHLKDCGFCATMVRNAAPEGEALQVGITWLLAELAARQRRNKDLSEAEASSEKVSEDTTLATPPKLLAL